MLTCPTKSVEKAKTLFAQILKELVNPVPETPEEEEYYDEEEPEEVKKTVRILLLQGNKNNMHILDKLYDDIDNIEYILNGYVEFSKANQVMLTIEPENVEEAKFNFEQILSQAETVDEEPIKEEPVVEKV